MFLAISAQSESLDAGVAFQEVREQCEKTLAGRVPKGGLLFTSVDMDHQELLDQIIAAWPGIQLVGCTADGEISSEGGYEEDSVTLLLFVSDTIDMTAGVGRNVSKGIPEACSQAVREARSKTRLEPALCITTPESLTASGHKIVEVLNEELGPDVRVFGATAGDLWRFTGTYQFHGGEVLSDAVPFLLFSGPLLCSYGVGSGWRPLGDSGRVTKADGAVVHEIDGAPAIEFYREMLGPSAMPSGECPLAILDSQDEVAYLRATPGTLDVETGAITFTADVPEGVLVRVTVADRQAILDGCRDSIQIGLDGYPKGKTPEAAVIFSCAARKLLLGTRTQEEAEIVQEVIGTSIPFSGFYGYGEIGPSSDKDRCSKFHNETFLSLLFGT
jgi:hypothetical protein